MLFEKMIRKEVERRLNEIDERRWLSERIESVEKKVYDLECQMMAREQDKKQCGNCEMK